VEGARDRWTRPADAAAQAEEAPWTYVSPFSSKTKRPRSTGWTEIGRGVRIEKSRVAGVGRHGRCVDQDVDSGLRPEVQSVEDVVNDGFERPRTHNSSALRIVQLQMTEDDRVMRDPEKLYQQTNSLF